MEISRLNAFSLSPWIKNSITIHSAHYFATSASSCLLREYCLKFISCQQFSAQAKYLALYCSCVVNCQSGRKMMQHDDFQVPIDHYKE